MKILLNKEITNILLDYQRRADAGDISQNTLKAVKNAFTHLNEYWGSLTPKDISKEKWAAFQDQFEKNNPSASQFNCKKYFTVLIKHLHEKEVLKQKIQIQDRFSRRERTARRKKKNWLYTPDEIKALDHACKDKKERIQIQLAYLMGFRISDCVKLTWDRIITTGKYAYVEFSGSDDKASTIARCPMPAAILEMLLEIPKISKWCFPQERNPDKHIKTQQINFTDLKRRAKVSRGTFHSLRHYCLSRDFKNPKLTTAQVCKMRRVSLQVAHEYYIHVSDDDMALLIAETK